MGSFGRGFITGLATSLDKGIQEDMAASRDRALRLADLSLEKGMKEQERYDREERENYEAITDMSKKLGGDMDAVQFLVDKHGFEGAKSEVESLIKLEQATNGKLTPQKVLGLESRSSGKVSAAQLSAYVTRPPTTYSLEGADTRVGFMKLLGSKEASTAQLVKMAEQEKEALGFGTRTSIEDMPTPVKGRGMYAWMKNISGNPVTDYGTFSERVNTLLEQKGEIEAGGGDSSEITKELEYATLLKQSALLKVQAMNSIGQPLTESQSKDYAKFFAGSIANRYNVSEENDWSNGIYQGTLGKAEQRPLLNEAKNIMLEVMNEARMSGMNPVTAQTQIERAITLNKVPVFRDGKIVITDSDLIDLQQKGRNNQLLFPMASRLENDNKANENNQDGNAGASSVQAPKDLQTQIDAYGNAETDSQRKSIIGKIMGFMNPSTGQPYTLQEAKNLVGAD